MLPPNVLITFGCQILALAMTRWTGCVCNPPIIPEPNRDSSLISLSLLGNQSGLAIIGIFFPPIQEDDTRVFEHLL